METSKTVIINLRCPILPAEAETVPGNCKYHKAFPLIRVPQLWYKAKSIEYIKKQQHNKNVVTHSVSFEAFDFTILLAKTNNTGIIVQ